MYITFCLKVNELNNYVRDNFKNCVYNVKKMYAYCKKCFLPLKNVDDIVKQNTRDSKNIYYVYKNVINVPVGSKLPLNNCHDNEKIFMCFQKISLKILKILRQWNKMSM